MTEQPEAGGGPAQPPAQDWQADRYARNARFVAELALSLLDWLAPKPGERILDLGCGDGALTEKLVAAGAIVVAVDAAPDMVRAAKARGLDARVQDARRLQFSGEFDAVFSNAALHWVPEADAVIAGVKRALKPHGRFVGEMGGAGNIASILDAFGRIFEQHGKNLADHSPWFFPSVEDYRQHLERAGFKLLSIELFPRPTPLPGPLSDWLATFGEPLLAAFAPGERGAVIDQVTELLAPRWRDPEGRWVLDYVRLRFSAQL